MRSRTRIIHTTIIEFYFRTRRTLQKRGKNSKIPTVPKSRGIYTRRKSLQLHTLTKSWEFHALHTFLISVNAYPNYPNPGQMQNTRLPLLERSNLDAPFFSPSLPHAVPLPPPPWLIVGPPGRSANLLPDNPDSFP